MTQLKELYKGKSLDDLEKYYELPRDLNRNSKIQQLCSTAQKLYKRAEECYIDGDEELSYIYYMKYFALIDFIRKMPEYSKKKQHVIDAIGGSKRQTSAMDKAEIISKSLKRRYELLAENEKTLKDDLNYDKTMTNMDSSNEDDDNNYPPKSLITCEDLFRMTQDPSTSLLVMDCRPLNDFTNSRMNYSCSVSVPEEIILPGMSAGRIQQQLEPNSKALWASRAIKDHVVLMDWNCKGPEPLINTPIWRLRDILQNWDPDTTYRSPIKVLQNGYEHFLIMYPTQCSNPNVQPPSSTIEDVDMIDDIEYPDINDITMKEMISQTVVPSRPDKTIFRPIIDRSSKPAAIQAIDEKTKKANILKEREFLINKLEENEKQLIETEKKWETVKTQADKVGTQIDETALLTDTQDLYYKYLQLQNKDHDIKLQNEILQKEFEEVKRREKETEQIIAEEKEEVLNKEEKEAENLELEQRIDEKFQERQRLDEQREKKFQEKAETMATIAREQQKRHFKPPIDDDEASKPKIPQVDRTSKPFIPKVIPVSKTITWRDFSPVKGPSGKGLTGLKNLGNTCYMNSIMQCISNTTPLVEYFVMDSYKKHINLANKTKGKIAEEVAALIKVLWSGQYKCVASKDLRYIVGQYQQIFRGIEQQDSHEFLTILMDWLHSDLLTPMFPQQLPKNLPASEKAWLDFTQSRESIILRLFYGQIKSTVKCVKCGEESATYESFSNLSLEIPEDNRCSLDDCLKLYFGGEIIIGWNCPKCKQKRDAIKKLNISKLPPILVIHLKRFYADPEADGNTYRKKQNYVIFPLVDLDTAPHVTRSESKSRNPKTYHLYAVSNHYGSMECGHYTAFCRNSIYKRWYKFDDQVVSSLDKSDVVSSAAYILFYTFLEEFPPAISDYNY